MTATQTTSNFSTFISFSAELNGWNWECWKGSSIIGRGKRENQSHNDAEFFAKEFLKRQKSFDAKAGW